MTSFIKTIQSILNGEDLRKAIIVGPCSIHNIEETLEYAQRLKKLSEEVEDQIFLVMRTFVEKPRTHATWKGFVSDPLIEGKDNLKLGIEKTLELFKNLNKLELPLAMEFIDPNLAPLFSHFISWGFIGARTTRSPTHRILASQLQIPIGFKNPLDGDITACINAQNVALSCHEICIPNKNYPFEIIKTQGNPWTHPVLRGSFEGPNYVLAKNFKSPVLIDCAHGNSQKDLIKMQGVFLESLELMIENPMIKGLMLESYLNSGCQAHAGDLKYGVSITDPCLDFETTEKLIQEAYKVLSIHATAIR
jgi:3-deoxy-7-phosphoheptulonate synthase